jgi:hypothetical protein
MDWQAIALLLAKALMTSGPDYIEFVRQTNLAADNGVPMDPIYVQSIVSKYKKSHENLVEAAERFLAS